jgi:hypothetical protein
MIVKQVPGADSVCMVYDIRDRLVLSQDGEQRKGNKWLFTKFDALNRPVLTGSAVISGSRENVQSAVDNHGARNETYSGTGPLMGYTNTAYPNTGITSSNLLTVTIYDRYYFAGTNTNPFGWNSAGICHDPTNMSPNPNEPSPHTITSNITVNTFNGQNYYINGGSITFGAGFDVPSGSTFGVFLGIAPAGNVESSFKTKGLVTGTMVKTDTDNTWLRTVHYYDHKYRVVQSISSNYANGYDDISFVYDFLGNLLQSTRMHNGYQSLRIVEKFEYDHAGRLIKHKHKTGSRDTVLLAEHQYNEIGELVNKKLHNNLDNVQYKYNIRGWLTDINNIDNSAKRFSMRLKYNEANGSSVPAQFNGNIAEMAWRNNGSERQVYGYTYDKLNRLTKAIYKNLSNSAKNNSFDVSSRNGEIKYDMNGNIMYLSRKKHGVAGFLDNLEYEYDNGGNQLTRVIDDGNKTLGFRDNDNAVDYEYDANGNLKLDRNKGITSIEYNHLNLPAKIWFGTNYIAYVYDAGGTKLEKEMKNGQSIVKTLYLAGIQYTKASTTSSWAMDFVQTSEGRITNPTGTTPVYEYDLKDHLGNSRVLFRENGQNVSTIDGYYPLVRRSFVDMLITLCPRKAKADLAWHLKRLTK